MITSTSTDSESKNVLDLAGRAPYALAVAAGQLPYRAYVMDVSYFSGKLEAYLRYNGVVYRNLPVVHYRVWCRERLQDHCEALAPEAREKVRASLEAAGAWEPLWRDGKIVSHLHDGSDPPTCRPPVLGMGERVQAMILGTTWERAGSGRGRR